MITGPGGYYPVMSEILAAGGVLWRAADRAEGVEIAIIHRPKYDDWSLPKGKLEPGETLLEAAVREVWEETGHDVAVGPNLGVITYLKANRKGQYQDKVVHFWAMHEAGGQFAPGDEVDDLEWIPPALVDRRLTYPMDQEVVRRLEWALASA